MRKMISNKQEKVKRLNFVDTLKINRDLSAIIDIYKYIGKDLNLYAYHVYKGKEYKGTYIVSSDNLEKAYEKLINNDVEGFAYNGGFIQENYISIKHL